MAVTLPRATRPSPGLVPLLAGCGVLAALSLLVLDQPTYDPAAWLVWGRQLGEGTFSTVDGPSWKPFPVAVTALLHPLGDLAVQWLWMWLARAGGLASVVLAHRLARRLGGRWEGLAAAAALVLATDYLYNAFRGDSEGLLVAFVLAAVLAGVADRRHLALGFGVLAALIRPEVAPLLVLWGLWMLRPLRWRTLLLLGAAGAAVAAAWYLPEQIGSGSGMRAATRAQHPVLGSPGQSAFPFGMAFVAAFPFLCWFFYAGALLRVRDAWRAPRRSRADRAVLWIALGSCVAMLEVAIGAELGFTGRMRYSTLPACGVAILGGLGLPGLVRQVRAVPARGVRVTLAVAAAGAVLVSLGYLGWAGVRLARVQERYGPQLSALVDAAGGPARVRACGPLATSPYERQVVAWRLGVDPQAITTRAVATAGTSLVLGDTASRLPVRARAGRWQLRSACALGSGSGRG